MNSASNRAHGRVSGTVHTSRFLVVLNHGALGSERDKVRSRVGQTLVKTKVRSFPPTSNIFFLRFFFLTLRYVYASGTYAIPSIPHLFHLPTSLLPIFFCFLCPPSPLSTCGHIHCSLLCYHFPLSHCLSITREFLPNPCLFASLSSSSISQNFTLVHSSNLDSRLAIALFISLLCR